MLLPRYNLIKLRKELNYTQDELAKKVGISRAYLSNIELGKYLPSLDVAKKISDELGVTVDYLFF